MPEVIRSQNLDSNESAFFARQLEFIKARSYDVMYPEFKATRLIPVSSEAGAGAAVITYQQFDRVGMAKVIANYADDLPRADIKGKEFSSPVRSLGVSYGYTVQEIRSAQMAGLPLTQRKANAARQSVEQMLNKIGWLAKRDNPEFAGMDGILFNPNVTSGSATNGSWLTPQDPDKILADMNSAVTDIIDLTKGVEVPDTMILPVKQFAHVSKTRLAAGTDTTILEFFKKNNPSVNTVEWVNELKSVTPTPSTGSGSTNCMIVYKRSPDKITYEIPQTYEQFPAQERNLEFVVPAHARVGGVIIYYPLSVNIVEGI